MKFGNPAKRGERGFSAIEILLVFALITIIVLIALPLFNRLIKNYKVQTSATQLAVQMRFARNAAVKQKLKHRIVITEGTDTYSLEKETTFNSGTYETIGNMDFSLPDGVTFDSSSTDGPVVFNSRGFTDSGTSYDIVLDIATESSSTLTYTVSVSPAGSISTSKNES